MTSVIRTTRLGTSLPDPANVVVLVWDNGTYDDVPVPFVFNRRDSSLDIDFSSGFTATTNVSTNDSKFFRGQSFGAINLVERLGKNFIAWCEGELSADVGSVRIYEKPIVVQANVVEINQDPNSVTTMSGASTIPITYEQAAGSLTDGFYTTQLFKKPLVITYTIGGTRYYRSFLSQFEGNT